MSLSIITGSLIHQMWHKTSLPSFNRLWAAIIACGEGHSKQLAEFIEHGFICSFSLSPSPFTSLSLSVSLLLPSPLSISLCACIFVQQWNSRKTLWSKTALKLRNLVHTDSQANNTHAYGHVSRKTPRNKIAPEIRRLGDTGSPASDVYAYGHILEDLSVIKNLPAGIERSSRDMALPSIRPLRISTQGSFRNQETDKFIKVHVSFRV